MLNLGAVEVRDLGGAQWKVGRQWIPEFAESTLDAAHRRADSGFFAELVVEFLAELAVRAAIVLWPFWFVAHWLGVAWVIVIECNGRTVAEEKVRGWIRSQRRMKAIADWVAAGPNFD